MSSLKSTFLILMVLLVLGQAKYSFTNCSKTQGQSYDPTSQACVVCASQSPCSKANGCKTVGSLCVPELVSDIPTFTVCTSMDPTFGFDGTCKPCGSLTQVQCTAVNYCNYNSVNSSNSTSGCYGNQAADYGKSFDSCTGVPGGNGYNALGYRSTLKPNCINCQNVSKADCPNTSGCKYNYLGSACTGMTVSDYNQNQIGCLGLGRGFTFIYVNNTNASTCYNCGSLTSELACQTHQSFCSISSSLQDTLCIGRQPNDTIQSLSSCTVFGSQYGFQGIDKACVDCSKVITHDNCNINKSCQWMNSKCSGMTLNSPNMNLELCHSFGPSFAFNASSSICVQCSDFLGMNCPKDICLDSGASCTALKIFNAVTFSQCTQMNPRYGWDVVSKQCQDCSQYVNQQTCNEKYFCIYTFRMMDVAPGSYGGGFISGCQGRHLDNYNNDKDKCLSSSPNFAFRTISQDNGQIIGQCIDCSVPKTENSCLMTRPCSWQNNICQRLMPNYKTCSDITDGTNCLHNSIKNTICSWDQYSLQCRDKDCHDLVSKDQCTNINGVKCTFGLVSCDATQCSSITDQSTCNKYQSAPFNINYNCIWAQGSNQCVLMDKKFQCGSYLNSNSCQSNNDGFLCNWNQAKSSCDQQTCKSLQSQSDCEKYSQISNQLNFQYCLWVQPQGTTTFSCQAYSLANCEDIQVERTCNNNNNPSGLKCQWANNFCSTMTCKLLSTVNCPRYVDPFRTLNGQHCYPTPTGCNNAPSNLQCSDYTEQVSCETYPNIASSVCSWQNGMCASATCTTFSVSTCSRFLNATLINNQQCLYDGTKCQSATCSLITDVNQCVKFSGKYINLNGASCVYLNGKCQTTNYQNQQYSCSDFTSESVCNATPDSSNGACQWNVKNLACQPFTCSYFNGALISQCSQFSFPQNTVNGYYCVPQGSTCQQIPPSRYSCSSFNGNYNLCTTHNLYLTKDQTSTCLYSNTTSTCYDAQYNRQSFNNFVCSDFSSNATDCNQALFKSTYRTTILCQFVNNSCIATQGNVCSGIIEKNACQGAHISGLNPCIWQTSDQKLFGQCVESTCTSLDKFNCLTAPIESACFWNFNDTVRPSCQRYTIFTEDITQTYCEVLGGNYNTLTGECGPKLCQHSLTAISCGGASGIKHQPLNCYWNHAVIDEFQPQCQPRLNPYRCQAQKNSGLACSAVSATIAECFQQSTNFGWNGECINCASILSLKQCSYTESACSWNAGTNTCVGQRLANGPAYAKYQGCLDADPSLGYSSNATITKCKQCLPLQTNTDCSYLLGCKWIVVSNTTKMFQVNRVNNTPLNVPVTTYQSYCTGLRAEDAFYSGPNSRARCESIIYQGYTDNGIQSECYDCSEYESSEECNGNPICGWSVNQCLGQRLHALNQKYNYLTCAAFGGMYGFDFINSACVNCYKFTSLLECDASGLTCNWDPIRLFCRGLRIDDQQISYAQCTSFGPGFGFSQSLEQKCVHCSSLTTAAQCQSLPDICVFTSYNICAGKRPSIAADFQSCTLYAPQFGFDTNSSQCLNCQAFNQTSCQHSSHCQYSDSTGCIGKVLSSYNGSVCVTLGSQFVVNNNSQCYDCGSQKQNCGVNNTICKSEAVSQFSYLKECKRSRGCFQTCEQVSLQQDCRDILTFQYTQVNRPFMTQSQSFYGEETYTRKTCNWMNNACGITQCSQFTKNTTCATGIALNSKTPNCIWVNNNCVPQSCNTKTTQVQCNAFFTTSINDQFCSWNNATRICTQIPKGLATQCSSFPNEQDCTTYYKPYQFQTICTWNIVGNSSVCQPARCGSYNRQDACIKYAQLDINGANCFWQATDQGGVCNQLKADQACSTFNNQQSCLYSKINSKCLWIQNKCSTRACNMQAQESACKIYSKDPISDGQYCLWVGSVLTMNGKTDNSSSTSINSGNFTYSTQCTTVKNITCSSFTSFDSCSFAPNTTVNGGYTLCHWTAQTSSCADAKCAQFNTADCIRAQTVPFSGNNKCFWNGTLCNTLSNSTSCTDYGTQAYCPAVTVSAQQCIWNSALSPAQCQVVQCNILTDEKSCLKLSTSVHSSANFCIWSSSTSQCKEQTTVTCNQITSSASCQSLYGQKKLQYCGWTAAINSNNGTCTDYTCSSLRLSDCLYIQNRLPSGTFCDIVNSTCVTLASNSCSSVVNKDVCSNLMFSPGNSCIYDNEKKICRENSCKSIKDSCKCIASGQPKCDYNFQSNSCDVATCSTIGLSGYQCIDINGCSWDPIESVCSSTIKPLPSQKSADSNKNGTTPSAKKASSASMVQIVMVLTIVLAL